MTCALGQNLKPRIFWWEKDLGLEAGHVFLSFERPTHQSLRGGAEGDFGWNWVSQDVGFGAWKHQPFRRTGFGSFVTPVVQSSSSILWFRRRVSTWQLHHHARRCGFVFWWLMHLSWMCIEHSWEWLDRLATINWVPAVGCLDIFLYIRVPKMSTTYRVTYLESIGIQAWEATRCFLEDAAWPSYGLQLGSINTWNILEYLGTRSCFYCFSWAGKGHHFWSRVPKCSEAEWRRFIYKEGVTEAT